MAVESRHQKVSVTMESNDSVFYSSEGYQNNNWLKFQASVKSGNLVEDAEGPLMICCQYEPLLCSDDHDLRHIHQISEQETPLDLSSVIRLEMKGEVVTREVKDQDSGYNPSPPLVDLADTPDEDLRQLTPEVRGPPDSTLRLYPHLRLTNTGALVLWNFLWALLQDINKRSIVRWVSVSDLEFQIVSKSLGEPSEKKNGKMNDIVHLSFFPLPPELIMTTKTMTSWSRLDPPPS